MTTHNGTFAGDKVVALREHLSAMGTLKIAAAIAVAFVLMYTETWAIEQSPLWSGACSVRPAANTVSMVTLPDTAGPIAVLH